MSNWARERNLIEGSSRQAQFVKLLEEVAELGKGLNARDEDEIKDAIGDCCVVLAILAAQGGTTLSECREHAWEQIKDRTGKVVAGQFVKD